MIQEIYPRKFKNQFQVKAPKPDSCFFYFLNDSLLLGFQDSFTLPTFELLGDLCSKGMEHSDFLFSIDSMDFFLIDETSISLHETECLKFYETRRLRELQPMWASFAAASASQLHRFYTLNRFCGFCKTGMVKSKKERALVCPSCGNTIYPKIAPAIIVAVIHEGKLLLTKYTGREYTWYALVAGYTEFGETLEETVKREVMEEVGLKVKNIRYYKNQPWAFTDSLLVGFWAELSGSPQIHLDETELSTAVFVSPEEISDEYTNVSLTHEMILMFKNGKAPY